MVGHPPVQFAPLRLGQRRAGLLGGYAIEDLLRQRDTLNDRHPVDAEPL